MIPLPQKTCLSCRKFRLDDPHSGICRVDKSVDHYPMKRTDESCALWQDAGQQYYIRSGWIKRTLATKEEAEQQGDHCRQL
ncbi:MAG: hypothetical protein KJ804_02085 [Proteobacteria bacterium]|nr:hypothetical protein [Pseudomonadota bacterium]MBU1057095.1 hypothetical protein [Pseudomonadota bacterium]